jgi:transcriptional regulator with XRE-family HTH domain
VKRLSDQTLYEILEVSPEASPDEIERACSRAAALYGPGSLATYTLMAPDEAALLTNRIDEARAVLLDADARARYDERIGVRPRAPAAPLATPVPGTLPAPTQQPLATPWPPAVAVAPVAATPVPSVVVQTPIATLDATPTQPLTSTVAAPPSTEPQPPTPAVEPPPAEPPPTPPIQGSLPLQLTDLAAPVPAQAPEQPSSPGVAALTASPVVTVAPPPALVAPVAPLPIPLKQEAPPVRELVVPEGSPWTGEMLRQVREARGLSVRQISDRTKIIRHHIENIELEKYEALPAAVYLRGILTSLARELRLDGQRVSRSFLERMEAVQAAAEPRKDQPRKDHAPRRP